MLNPKARRFLLIQQQLRIARHQAALAATPDYATYNAALPLRRHTLAALCALRMAACPNGYDPRDNWDKSRHMGPGLALLQRWARL